MFLALALPSATVDVALGAGLAGYGDGYIYSFYVGAGPHAAARIYFPGDAVFMQGTTDAALQPVTIYTGPTGPYVQQSGLNGAFTFQQTVSVGYRFAINDEWALLLSGGGAGTYALTVSGDAMSGGPYMSALASVGVRRALSSVFAIESVLMTSGAPRSYGGSIDTFVVRPALSINAAFTFGD